MGCGSGEDFSKPPVAIQQRQTNAESSSAPTAEGTPAAATDTAATDMTAAGEMISTAGNSESSEKDSVSSPGNASTAPATTESASANSVASMSKSGASGLVSAAVAANSAPASESRETPAEAAATTPAAATDASEVVTASGKSEAAISEKKEANSQKSVAGNAKGLLDSLRGASAPDSADAPGEMNPSEAQQQITRFGRFAMSRGAWLQLVTKLTKRFFVAATPDGSRLAASSGERSAGVVNTRIELLRGNVQNFQNAVRAESTEPILQSVTGLAGLINAVELTHDGNLALIGTTDGRLLARSTASTTDWDLYARDFFLYQDEHRKTSRLSTEAIVVVRCLPDDRILTVDGNGLCALWKMNDAVYPPTPVLEMTVEQAKRPEADTIIAAQNLTFAVSGFQVLSVAVSEDGLLGAIVTSAEEVTIFDTTTGVILDTLSAGHFADTQPVCAEFLPDRREVLVGLADGRILRRAFADGTPISGSDDNGNPVDYDAVFVPDLQDTRGSITCLSLTPAHNMLYLGSIDGTVSRLDLTHRRLEQTVKRHEGPVLEFRMTQAGVMSIGDDRRAHLFDMPVSVLNPNRDAVRTFQLPVDQTLEETVPDEEPAAAPTAKNTKSTRPVRSGTAPVAEDLVDLSLTGIRPSDATQALLEHQLRSASDEPTKLQLRKALLEHRGQQSAAAGLGTEPRDAPAGAPLRTGEITTTFNFSSGGWNRILLAIADDGQTAASACRDRVTQSETDVRAKAVCVWDMATGTNLRRWTQPGNLNRLALNEIRHLVIPTPVIARLSTLDGHFLHDPSQRHVSSAFSPDRGSLVLGHFGEPGIASHSLTRISLQDTTLVSSLERFEATIPAIAWSESGDTLFVSTRERDQTRLLEVDSLSLSLRTEIIKEQLSGSLTSETSNEKTGAVVIVPSPSAKMLLTWGNYEDGPQLRLLRKNNTGWPQEDITVIRDSDAALELSMTDQPAVFINHQDSRLALITGKGIVMLSTRKATVMQALPIPSFGGHRPVAQFSPDHSWLLTGDGEGTISAYSLNSLSRKPLTFSAHPSPIAGLALSPNGKYLISAGEDNRLRSWRVDGFLKR